MSDKLARLAVALGGLATLAGAGRAEEQHPRLFLTPERVAAVRKQVAVAGSHHQLAFADLTARVEKGEYEGGYGLGCKAVEAAFLSAIAEVEADKVKYALTTYQALAAWTETGSATLGKSMEARCLALAYDWAYRAWTAEQRRAMRTRVDAVLSAMSKISHSNLGGDRTSNFVGVIRGAELLLLLASGADVKSERCRFLIGELKRYFDNAFGDLGACQEGPGYTEYPGPFAFGAAYAAREAGDSTLYDAAAKHAFWKLVMYTRTAGEKSNRIIMWGVGSGNDYTEGWSSVLFHLCPPDQLPYYVWWYDRAVGRLAPTTMAHRFDSDRHGTVWALLYYPASLTAKDPTGAFPPAVADSRGYVFFRNRWRDANDILASVTAQVRNDQKGWNQPEQLAISLMGYDTRFIGGPAKETKPHAYSSLLVDGKYTYKDATEPMGKLVAFEPGKTGGYAIVQGGQMYTKLGVKEAVRHTMVDFAPAGANLALLSTLGRVCGDGQHTYTWQANVGPGATFGAEAGRKSFLLKGAQGGFVKGWVVHPADAQVGPAPKPLQISTRATDADIWVVILVGHGEPPTATITGTDMEATVSVGGKVLRWDASSGRIACK
jgi:hypothetical protein